MISSRMPPEEPADQARKEQLEQRLKEHRLQNRFHQAAEQAKKRLTVKAQEASESPEVPARETRRTD